MDGCAMNGCERVEGEALSRGRADDGLQDLYSFLS